MALSANWNAGAKRIKGYTADEVVGQHFQMFYSPEDREAGLPARSLETARENGKFEAEGWRVRKDGSKFLASVVIDALYEENEFVGFAKITRDITERNKAADSLRESERHFRLLVNGVTDYALYMLDPIGVVTNWNPGAQRIKGYLPNEIIGQHFSRFYSSADQAPAGLRVRSGLHWKAVATRKRAGAFARTVPSFGQVSSLIRYEMTRTGLLASPRSPVISPSVAKPSRRWKNSS